jgi:hypothetical protein
VGERALEVRVIAVNTSSPGDFDLVLREPEMSEDSIHRQKFTVEQWPTTRVTIYPTRAGVVRQIESVKLKVNPVEPIDLHHKLTHSRLV